MNRPATPFLRHAIAGLVVAALVTGCATRETGSLEASRNLAQSRSLSRTFHTRLGLAVAAADAAAKAFAKNGNDTDRLVYNQACTEVATLSTKVALPVTLQTPEGPFRLAFDATQPAGVWKPAFFKKLIPTADIRNKALVAKTPPDGFGGALVGVHLPPNPRALYLPRVGVSAPVTAVVNIAPPARPGEPAQATLTLYDSARRNSARVAGAKRPLAADLSAPFGFCFIRKVLA